MFVHPCDQVEKKVEKIHKVTVNLMSKTPSTHNKEEERTLFL